MLLEKQKKRNLETQNLTSRNVNYCNNKVSLRGYIEEPFKLNHEISGTQFFKGILKVKRFSDNFDVIAVMVSEEVYSNVSALKVGQYVKINGEYRSYNKVGADEKTHLDLFVFANSIEEAYASEEVQYTNIIYLEGYICKNTEFRRTPMGYRITDILLAVNRGIKSDYIPCIAWGYDAEYAKNLKVGDFLKFKGRVQSRTYYKENPLNPLEKVEKIAYEVSIMKILDKKIV